MEILIILVSSAIAYSIVRKAIIWQKWNKFKSGTPVRKGSLSKLIDEVFSGAAKIDNRFETGFSNVTAKLNNSRNPSHHSFDDIAKLSIIGESAWYGAEAINNLIAVDSHVYESLSHLAGEQMDSISDLSSYLQDHWQTDWLGNLSALNNFQGHLAEFTVADHLRELGHTVTFPETSNYPGVDMWVDGHPFNVKNVVDMSSIKEHFARYPDVGVISNFDVNGISENIIHFDPSSSLDAVLDSGGSAHFHIVDNGLNHDTLVDHADSAADALTGNIDMHFPIITMGLSGYREVKLMMKGHTDFLNSAKNIALDTAGTGVGGFAGAKAGAALGSFIFPGIGTAIGAIVGGIGGAIAGRFVTNQVKTEPMEQAKAQYLQTLQNVQDRIKEIDVRAKQRVDGKKNEEQKMLENLCQESKRKLLNLSNQTTKALEKTYELTDSAIKYRFESQLATFTELRNKYEGIVDGIGFWDKYIWISDSLLIAEYTINQIDDEIALIQQAQKAIFESGYTQKQKTSAALSVLAAIGSEDAFIKQHLRGLKESVDIGINKLASEIDAERIKISNSRIAAFKRIRQVIEVIKDESEKELSPLLQSLASSKDKLHIEMKKLGLVQ